MLAVAVFLDALVVRCMLLPAVLELLGPITWRLPHWLDARLPHINIEGSGVARACRARGDLAGWGRRACARPRRARILVPTKA